MYVRICIKINYLHGMQCTVVVSRRRDIWRVSKLFFKRWATLICAEDVHTFIRLNSLTPRRAGKWNRTIRNGKTFTNHAHFLFSKCFRMSVRGPAEFTLKSEKRAKSHRLYTSLCQSDKKPFRRQLSQFIFLFHFTGENVCVLQLLLYLLYTYYREDSCTLPN